MITTGSSRQLLPAWLYLLHPCSRIQAMTLTAQPHSLQVSMHKDVPVPRRTGSPRAVYIDVEHTFQALCPLVRMSRCRGAHGCAGATKSLIPGAQQAFGLMPAQASGPFYPCPAGPVLPMHDTCYGARIRRYSQPVPLLIRLFTAGR